MKNNISTFIALGLIFLSLSCKKQPLDQTPVLENRDFAIEKIVCDDTNRYFDWWCSFDQNYIQKNISTATEKNFTFSYRSDNFAPTGFGFRTLIFVNGIIRFRTTTRTFPFETTLKIPEKGIVYVQTYIEKYASATTDESGVVNCKVLCEQ